MLSDTDKFVYGLDRKTGSLVWKTQLPGYVDSSPAIAGDKVRFQMILCCGKCWLVGWLVGWLFLDQYTTVCTSRIRCWLTGQT